MNCLKPTTHKTVLFFLLLFFFAVTKGQKTVTPPRPFCTTRGILIDSINCTPVSYASIILLDKNQVVVSQIKTDKEGRFLIEPYCNQKYYIQIFQPGFKDKTIPLYIGAIQILHLGAIDLSPKINTMNNIVISASKKKIEIFADKTVFHVSNDPDANYSYLHEMIQKIPGVFADADDDIYVRGSQNILILVNGRKSGIMNGNIRDIFKTFPSSNIKDIEISYTPPARWASEGVDVVVNLVLHKRNVNGYNGSLGLMGGHPSTTSENVSYLLKNNKISFSAMGTMNTKNNPTTISNYTLEDLIVNKKVVRNGSGTNNTLSQFLNSELTWEIDSLRLLAVNFGYSTNKGKSNYLSSTSTFMPDGGILSSFDNHNNGNFLSKNMDWGADFEAYSKRHIGQTFSLSYKDILRSDSNNYFFEIIPFKNILPSLNTTQNQDYFKERTFQINFTRPFKLSSFDIGAKWIQRTNKSNYFYKTFNDETNEFILDSSFSNDFTYNQNVYSAYSSLNIRNLKRGLSLGISLDKVNIDADFISTSSSLIRDYVNIIPTASFSQKFWKSLILKIGYAQMIERPSLMFINPYVNRIDPYYITYGNPDLNPALTHSYEANINFFKRKFGFNISVNHRITNNAILSYTRLDENQISRTTYGNIGYRSSSNANLGMNVTLFHILNINMNYTPTYLKYSAFINNEYVFRSGLVQMAYSNFSLKLDDGLRINGSASYTSSGVILQGRSSNYINTSFHINKDFGKRKNFTINFGIINPHAEKRKVFFENMDQNFYLYNESISIIKQYQVRANYRFGGFQGKVLKKKNGINNSDLKTGE